MRKLFSGVALMARRFGWISAIPMLAVCSADHSTTIVAGPPAAVTNLGVQSTTDNTATLSFTQVEDGMGQPAKYDVRFAAAPISWASAASVSSGTCATPLNGNAIGASLACTVQGLSPATEYNFQVVAYRGTLNSQAVLGQASNVADGTTTGGSNPPPPPPPPPPPAPVVTTVSVSPSTASVQVGATTSLNATVKDQNGIAMTGQTVTWSSDKTGTATVNSSGVVSGVAAGSATITAASSGKSGTATITVTAAPPPAPVVTTVTVSPTSVSVQVGATSNLAATVKDQNGNAMAGQTVTWSSNNTSFATVSSSGVVTGVAAGSATITATSSGKSGTSAVTVTAAPPPPPPPPPGGGTLLFSENFEDSNIGSRGWYDNTGAVISTVEHITGSTASAQYHWTQGATSPAGNGAQRHLFPASNSVYLSYYVKYSANYVGSGQDYHPHEFYILSTMDDQYDGLSDNYMDIYIEQNYLNGGRPVIAMQDNKMVNSSYGALPHSLVGVTENRSTAGCNGMVESNMYSECFDFGSYWYNLKHQMGPVTFQPNPGTGYKNTWNYVEAYVQLNTITNGKGNADGVMQYWFNGQLVIDRHDILFRTGQNPNLQLNQLVIAPYIGDGSPADQYMWIDNLRVATGRIP